VAWRFLTHLSERDIVDVLLYELSHGAHSQGQLVDTDRGEDELSGRHLRPTVDENTSLLTGPPTPGIKRHRLPRPISHLESHNIDHDRAGTFEDDDHTSSFRGLNALEIAVVVDAKKFLSQRAVQKIVNGIWSGKIVFWESMSVHTTKKPHFYNQRFVFHSFI